MPHALKASKSSPGFYCCSSFCVSHFCSCPQLLCVTPLPAQPSANSSFTHEQVSHTGPVQKYSDTSGLSHFRSHFKDFHALAIMNSSGQQLWPGEWNWNPDEHFLTGWVFLFIFQLVKIPTSSFSRSLSHFFTCERTLNPARVAGWDIFSRAVKFHPDLTKWNSNANLHLRSLGTWQSLCLFCLLSTSLWIRWLPAQLVTSILFFSFSCF